MNETHVVAERRIDTDQGVWTVRFHLPELTEDGEFTVCRLVLADPEGGIEHFSKGYGVDSAQALVSAFVKADAHILRLCTRLGVEEPENFQILELTVRDRKR